MSCPICGSAFSKTFITIDKVSSETDKPFTLFVYETWSCEDHPQQNHIITSQFEFDDIDDLILSLAEFDKTKSALCHQSIS